MFVVGLDSNRAPFRHRITAKGLVDKDQLDLACDYLSASQSTALRIAAIHHPLSDPPKPELIGNNLLHRAAIAKRLQRAGADLVLSGHVHQHFTVPAGPDAPLHNVTGTGCQMLSPHPCCFDVIDVFRNNRFTFGFSHYTHTRSVNSSFELMIQPSN